SEKALANIQLLCEDGPLLQIKHYTNAYTAWNALKELYNPCGFISEYLLIKELFEATLDKYSSIEEYLNKIKEIIDELKVRNLELPKQVVIAWILYSLGDPYEGLVSNITQSLRKDPNAYNFESLASTLIDEAKRQESKEISQSFMVQRNNKKNKWKVTKSSDKFCSYCKLTSHITKDCYFLHPNKAPASWKNKARDTKYNAEKTSRNTSRDKDKEQALYTAITPQTELNDSINNSSNIEEEIDIFNMDLDTAED